MRALLTVAAGLFALTAVAASGSSTTAPPAGALLGGGAIGPSFDSKGAYGLRFVTVAVSRDGRKAKFYGDWNATCRGLDGAFGATFYKQVVLKPNGSFSGSGVLRTSVERGAFSFKGRFTGARRAEGTGSARFRLRRGKAMHNCKTGGISWQARAAAAPKGRPRPRRGGSYYGNTSQNLPIVLRVSPDGTQIAQAALLWNAGCFYRRLKRGTVSAATRIRRNGTFALTIRYDDHGVGPGRVGKVASTETGRFGAASAAGTWRVHVEIRRASDGAILDDCDSGRIAWKASP